MENFERREETTNTDMELVLLLIRHIDNPCEDLHSNNMRNLYIEEVKKTLDTLQNPAAKQMLEDVIQKYSK